MAALSELSRRAAAALSRREWPSELSRREPYHAWACDMWAFACVVYEILENKPAYRGSSMEQLNIRIMRGSHEAFTEATPPPARSLIKGLLQVDVANRMPAAKALAHPWFGAQAARIAID